MLRVKLLSVNGNTALNSTATVTVTGDSTTVPVEGVTLNTEKIELLKNTNYAAILTAYVAPINATNQAVVWTSSDTNVVTVADGILTTGNLGQATVTATTVDGDFIAECLVNVTDVAGEIFIDNFTFDETEIEVDMNDMEKEYSVPVTFDPANATAEDLTWVSSDESVVKVENGVLIPVFEGKAIVTATSYNGLTQQCAVTVINPDETYVQEDDENLLFSAGWNVRAQIGKFDNHFAMHASKKNETMQFTFIGNYFELLSYKSYSQARFDVYVDGVKIDNPDAITDPEDIGYDKGMSYDLYEKGTPDTSFKIPVAGTAVPYGEHTVTVVIVGKHPKSVGYNMYLDAVKIYGEFVSASGSGSLQDDEIPMTSVKAVTYDVLLNDDVAPEAVVDSVTDGVNGTTEITDDGLIVYTPTKIDLRGDEFTYTVGDQTATVRVSYAEGVKIRVEETASMVTFEGAKWKSYKLAAYSGGAAMRSSTKDETVTITFYGSSIDVIGYKSWSRGQFSVSIDGGTALTYSSFDKSYDKFYKEPIYQSGDLGLGEHTLVLTVLGKKDTVALGTAIDIDAFDIG